jgi:hypothetical protein
MSVRTALWALLPVALLIACHKDSSSPATANTPLGTMNIDLTYPRSYSQTAFYELVISEPGGKTLLDTIVQFNTAVKAALRTNATLVDMILIDTTGGHNVTVYKSVNPSTWINTFPGSYVTKYRSSLPGSTSASVHYTNFPNVGATGTDIFNTFFFNNGPVGSQTGISFYPSTNTLDLGYWRYPGAYNYLAIPQLGLYKLYIPASAKDTMDLSHMDTAIAITYPRPTPFTTSYFGITFLGITDSTNRTLDVNFMDPLQEHPVPNVDLQYPRQPMQLYELYYAGLTAANEGVGFYSYGKTVPTNWNYLDPASFTVSSVQPDNLSVQYKGSAPATVASSYWTTSNNSSTLSIFWHPDSTSIHPLTLLTGLKAKFLSGAALSDLKCSSFTFEQMPGFTYSSYFTTACDPAKMATHPIRSSNYYIKYF